MATTFISDADLKTSLAGQLGMDPADMAARWDAIIKDSNESAYQTVVAKLTDRGYTAQQIAAWDRAPEYNRDIALYWCLVKGAGLHGNDSTFIFKLNRTDELDTVAVLIDGVVPSPTGAASVGWGVLDTECDRYTKDTPLW